MSAATVAIDGPRLTAAGHLVETARPSARSHHGRRTRRPARGQHALLAERRVVAGARIDDSTELLWDHPELERLWARLRDDFEIALALVQWALGARGH